MLCLIPDASDDGDDDVFGDDVEVADDTPLAPGAPSGELTKENLALLAGSIRIQPKQSGGSNAGSDENAAGSNHSDHSKKDEGSMLDVNSNSALIRSANPVQADSSITSSKKSNETAAAEDNMSSNSSTSSTNKRQTEANHMPTINVIPHSASPPNKSAGFFPTQREMSSLSSASRRARSSDNPIPAMPKQPLPQLSKSVGAMPEEGDSHAVDDMKQDSENAHQSLGTAGQSDDKRKTIDRRSSNLNRLSQEDVTGSLGRGSQRSRSSSSAKTSSRDSQDLRLSTRSNTVRPVPPDNVCFFTSRNLFIPSFATFMEYNDVKCFKDVS